MTWPLLAAPWPLVFLSRPFTGFLALSLVLYPAACLSSKRTRDIGGGARWLAPVWIVILGLILDGANSYLAANALASLSGWPGGRGLLDFGDMGGLYQVAGAALIFLVTSLIVGLMPSDDGSKNRNAAVRMFE